MCSVRNPPAPIETIWLVRNGGLNGAAVPVGAPKALSAFVKPLAKPLPGLYDITASANPAANVRDNAKMLAEASARKRTLNMG